MSELFPKNAWYAVGGIANLAVGEVMPVQLFGEERVAWRGGNGDSHVWHNRCIHRGMRLQYGFVDGDRLACRYHGWRFGGDAKCQVIPAHPDMTPPDDYCIPAFPSMETHGLIWTTCADTGTTLPDLPDIGNLIFCRTVAVDAAADHAAAVVEDAGLSVAAPGVYSGVVSANGEDTPTVVAIQPVNAGKSQLHVSATEPESGDDLVSHRLSVSGWAKRLRDTIEIGSQKETAS